MSNDWGDGFGDGDDPFGVSEDVFGAQVGDVDVWDAVGNGSFGDGEWGNGDDGGGGGGHSATRRKVPSKAAAETKKKSSKSSSRSSGSHRKDSGRREKDSSRRKSSSRSRSKSPSRSNRSTPRSGGSPSTRRRTKNGGDGFDEDPFATKPRPPLGKSLSDGFGRKDVFQNSGGFGDDGFGNDGFGSSDAFGSTGDDGFGSSSGGGFASFDDKFGGPRTPTSGGRGKLKMGDDDDGFGDFEAFGGSPFKTQKSPGRSGSRNSPSQKESPLSPGMQKHRQKIRSSQASSGFPDDNNSLRSGRRSSSGGGSTHSRRSTLVRQRDGQVSRSRHSLQTFQQSSRRRGNVMESLRDALGDSMHETGPSLGTFFGGEKPSRSRRGDSGGSVQSAPAMIARSSSDRRSRRREGSRKSSSSTTPTTVPEDTGAAAPKSSEGVKLDLAELAKAGYLEVQDGKMRLVIDVDQ